MRLTSGTRVGPYEVLAPLGSGGMAVVYRARDTRLGREVALKVMSEALAGDGALLGRFEQESRLAGSLNHPNVVAVHDVGLHEGAPFFVTELLQGQTLRERLAKGPVPLATALDWAVQMAHGLAAAHERGIVHRDLKPENVFVTRDGQVKLLDFGIAKLVESARRHEPRGLMDATESPAGGSTGTGMVIGTPGYMSPEQVRGDPVDARTDFFSLGAVLYELLSGRRAFPGGALVESGHAILHDEPAPLPPEVPVAVGQVVLRCLEKDPDRRFQSARDLAFHLELLRAPTGSVQTVAGPRLPPRRRRWLWPAVAAALGVALAAGVVAERILRREPGLPVVRPLTFNRGAILSARFAPDGKTVHFGASAGDGPVRIFTTSIGTPEVRSLVIDDAQLQAVSRSGELAITLHPKFVWFDAGRGTLARIPALGGTPREIATDVEYADWAPDGEQLAIARFEGESGRLEYPIGRVLFESTGWVSNPRVSPDGTRVAFVNHPVTGDNGGEILVVDRAGKVELRSGGWAQAMGVAWSAGGRDVLFTAGRTGEFQALWRLGPDGRQHAIYRGLGNVRLDDVASDGRLLVTQMDWRQELELLAPKKARPQSLDWLDWARLCCISDDGTAIGFDESGDWVVNEITVFLRWVGERTPVRLGPGGALALSPDGKWVVSTRVSSPGKLWFLPTGPGTIRAVDVPLQGRIAAAAFFRDGKRLALIGREKPDGAYQLFVYGLETGVLQRLATRSTPAGISAVMVSPDGARVATFGQDGFVGISRVDGGEPVALTALGHYEVPDGWLEDGSLLSHASLGLPARLSRWNPVTGKTSQVASLMPADPAGVERITRVRATPDLQTMVLNYRRARGALFVLDWKEGPP